MNNLKHWIIATVLPAAIVVTAILVNLDKTAQEPVKIYKTTTPLPKQTDIRDNTPSINEHAVQAEDAATTESTTATKDYVSYDTYDPKDNTDVNFTETEAEIEVGTGKPWEETVEAERLTQKLLEDWDNFSITLLDKYPKLFDAQAIAQIANTQEGRDHLKSQVESMLEDTFDEFERLFTQLPADFAEEVLDALEVHFQQNPTDIPQRYINQALNKMRARLN